MPLPLIVILISALALGGGTGLASQSSLPGDNLFSVKEFTEKTRIALSRDGQADNIRLDILEKRAREIAEVLDRLESGRLNENRGTKGLEKAIDNIKQHSSKILRDAGTIRQNEGEKSLELHEDLQSRLLAVEFLMEDNLQEKHKEDDRIKRSLSSLSGLSREVRGKISEMETEDLKNVEREKVSARIKKAEDRLSATEKKLDGNDSGRQILGEAKNLIDSAKKEMERNEIEDAFRKANEAVRLASALSSLAEIEGGKSRKIFGDANSAAASMRQGPEIKVSAHLMQGKSEAKIETEFVSDKKERAQLAEEIIARINLAKENAENLLVMQQGAESPTERIRVEAEIEDGVSAVKAEIRFPVNSDQREAIIKEIENRLSALSAKDILDLLLSKDAKENKIRLSGETLKVRTAEPGEDIRGNADENEVRGNADEPAELRGRANEPGEDIRGNADEAELRGRANEPGEDISGNADEPAELRGRANEPEEDVRGNADEAEARGSGGDSNGDDSKSSGKGGSDDD